MLFRDDLKDWQIAQQMFGNTEKRTTHVVKKLRKLLPRWAVERLSDEWCYASGGDDWWLIPSGVLSGGNTAGSVDHSTTVIDSPL